MLPLCLAQQCTGEALLCPVAAALLNSHQAAPQAAMDFSVVGGGKTAKASQIQQGGLQSEGVGS